MKTHYERFVEVIEVIEPILPFDDEYDADHMFRSNEYVYVTDFGNYNPMLKAWFNEEKKEAYLHFWHLSPLLRHPTRMKFRANNMTEAAHKTFVLHMEVIMLSCDIFGRSDFSDFVSLAKERHERIERLKKEEEAKEGAAVERQPVREVG